MNTAIIIFSVIQAISISLGVGSSTIAILNFFQAIKDGKIDPIERSFMGVTYIALRIAMIIILLTTIGLAMFGYYEYGNLYITSYVIAQIFLILILFLNATLMTKRIMPSTFGPAIQASSWYALGFILALSQQGLGEFSFITFTLLYAGLIVLATLAIGAVMKYQTNRLPKTK